MKPTFQNRHRPVIRHIRYGGMVAAGLALLVAGTCARADDDPYGLKRQQRMWQTESNHYDAWINDIRSRNSRGTPGVAKVEWKTQGQRLREWQEWERNWKAQCDARRAEDEAWEAQLDAYSDDLAREQRARNAAIDAENVEIRRMNTAMWDSVHKDMLEDLDGMGTKQRPPAFSTPAANFNYYLGLARNGDPYGAFYVGRALLEGLSVPRNEASAAMWLEKSNLEWGEAAALLGSILVTNRSEADRQRGLDLLEHGSKNDKFGAGAWIAGTVYANGSGVKADPDKAAYHLARAYARTRQDDPWSRFNPRPDWGPPVGEWEGKAARIALAFEKHVAAQPDRIQWWVREWRQDSLPEAKALMDVALAAPASAGCKPQSAYLDRIEAGESMWSDAQNRNRFLNMMRARNCPDLAAHEAKAKEQGDKVPLRYDFSPTRNMIEKRGDAWSDAELDAAYKERIEADKLPPGEARSKALLAAFEKGDALALWPLLDDNSLLQSHAGDIGWLVKTMERRLLRDEKGQGERAASAALALHFLYRPDAVGILASASWRYGAEGRGKDTTDWLKVAVGKGHPWAVYFAGANWDAASDRKNPDWHATWDKVGTLLTAAVADEEGWRRDARLLGLRPPEDDIVRARDLVEDLKLAQADATRYDEVRVGLEAARGFCARRGGTFGDSSAEADALLKKAFKADAFGREAGFWLNSHRSETLQYAARAAMLGDGFAAFTVGEVLGEAEYPYTVNPAEVKGWMEVARTLLERRIKSADPSRAMDAALFLGRSLLTGENLPRDVKAGLSHLEFAGVGGHYQAASDLWMIYQDGRYGVAPNSALAKKWERISGDIISGKYKAPGTVKTSPAPAKPKVKPSPAPGVKRKPTAKAKK